MTRLAYPTAHSLETMADALDALGDALSRGEPWDEAERLGFLDVVAAGAWTFRSEAARLSGPPRPRLVVDEPDASLAPVIPFRRPEAEE